MRKSLAVPGRLRPPSRWPAVIGAILTLAAIGVCALITERRAETITVGDFALLLAGFSSMVAFFWLILGYFAQHRTLHMQTIELLRQAQEFELNRQSIEQSAQIRGITSFLDLYGFIQSSVSLDVRSLVVQAFHQKNLPDVSSADHAFNAGHRDAYVTMLLERSQLLDAIEEMVREQTSMTVRSYLITYTEKFRVLHGQLERIPMDRSTYRVLLESSPLRSSIITSRESCRRIRHLNPLSQVEFSAYLVDTGIA
jgi:hypothetical protein